MWKFPIRPIEFPLDGSVNKWFWISLIGCVLKNIWFNSLSEILVPFPKFQMKIAKNLINPFSFLLILYLDLKGNVSKNFIFQDKTLLCSRKFVKYIFLSTNINYKLMNKNLKVRDDLNMYLKLFLKTYFDQV